MFEFLKKKDETSEEQEEKYKFLYEFQLKGFESAKALYAKHDDKAMKFITIISINLQSLVCLLKKLYL